MMEYLYNAMQAVADAVPWLMPVFFAMFGACIGSFLNVVIYRMPRGLSVSDPARSFCPTCKEPIPWYLNIPILSWLMLGGRSACCHTRISVRYWLVEVVTAALFALVAWYYPQEDVVTQVLLCIWLAVMLATFCTDWEQMAVLPVLMVIGSVSGVLVAMLSPWMVGYAEEDPALGVKMSLVGAVAGFVFFRLVGWAGTLVFGRRSRAFDSAQEWTLYQAEDGEDIVLELGGQRLLWSSLFAEPANRLWLQEAQLSGGKGGKGELVMTPESVICADGTELELESVESLSGTCRGYRSRQAAMGSGDAWIALGIGALLGWQGVLFSLVAGSFIGLLWAVVARVGLGKPMPFGPALILSAAVWLFLGVQIENAVLAYMGL